MYFFKPLDNFHPTVQYIKSKSNERIYSRHLRTINRVKVDWINANVDVANDHPLIRAITQINANTDDLYRAYMIAKEQQEAIASQLEWLASTSNGKSLSKPYFFLDKSTPEFILLVEREDSNELVLQQLLHEDKNYWTSWEPVRVRYHCYTDMDYYPCSQPYPNQTRISQFKEDVNIIEVDLALLYLQYRYWLNSPMSHIDEVSKTIGQFLSAYPLPNMIDQMMYLAYFNRMRCIFTDTAIETSRPISKRHAYTNTYQWIDESIVEVYKNYKKQGGLSFDRVVSNLPYFDIDRPNYGIHFKRDEYILQPWILPILVLSVLPLYEVWIKIILSAQQQKWNTDNLAAVKRGLRSLKQANIFSRLRYSSTDTKLDLATRLDSLLSLL